MYSCSNMNKTCSALNWTLYCLKSQNMGFDEGKAEEALLQFGSVQSAVDAILAGRGQGGPYTCAQVSQLHVHCVCN